MNKNHHRPKLNKRFVLTQGDYEVYAVDAESGALSGISTVQRINTKGGAHAGACDTAGAFHSAPYAADYVFLRKGP